VFFVGDAVILGVLAVVGKCPVVGYIDPVVCVMVVGMVVAVEISMQWPCAGWRT